MFEVSNWGFLGVLSPFRPLHGVPRVPRHVYRVSHLNNLTFGLIELQTCAMGLGRGFWGCSVHLNNPHVAHETLDTCTTYHVLFHRHKTLHVTVYRLEKVYLKWTKLLLNYGVLQSVPMFQVENMHLFKY